MCPFSPSALRLRHPGSRHLPEGDQRWKSGKVGGILIKDAVLWLFHLLLAKTVWHLPSSWQTPPFLAWTWWLPSASSSLFWPSWAAWVPTKRVGACWWWWVPETTPSHSRFNWKLLLNRFFYFFISVLHLPSCHLHPPPGGRNSGSCRREDGELESKRQPPPYLHAGAN